MNKTKLIPLTDPKQVPAAMTDDDARVFWDVHEITEDYLSKAGSDNEGPPTRARKPVLSRSTSLRLEQNTAERLKTLADKKGMAYQTLLKQFVLERLYEEEKREGVV